MNHAVVLVLLVLVAGCVQTSTDQQTAPAETHSPQTRTGFSVLFTDLAGCEERSVTFTHAPIDIAAIRAVEPQGELTDATSGHITPGDHVGFQYDIASVQNVYAIGNGVLKRVERNRNFFDIGKGSNVKNYHLYFEYSCSVFGSYVHVTALDEALLNADAKLKELDALPDVSESTNRHLNVKIPVKAGQILGKAQEYGLLGMLTVDTDVTLNFVNPEQYKGEPWKVHSAPVFDYFTDELRAQLFEKNPRTKEPRGGKIDFDTDGKLVGNWFLEGTDYAGDRTQAFCGDYICPYWNGHLAFAYDFVDPDQVRVSIGYDAGISERGPYGVKGNAPNPKDVGVGAPVKYELVGLEDISAQYGYVTQGKALITKNKNDVVGIILVQLTDARTVRMEVFPGKSAADVTAFTGAAKVYSR